MFDFLDTNYPEKVFLAPKMINEHHQKIQCMLV